MPWYRIVPLVRQFVAAGVPEHVGVDWEGHVGPLAKALDQRMEAFWRHRGTALACEYEERRFTLALQPTQSPDLVALERMGRWRPTLAAPDMKPTVLSSIWLHCRSQTSDARRPCR